MTTGKNAMLGIGNKSRTSGSAAVRIPIHQPMARPSAVPGINAIRKEVISRPRVVPAWTKTSQAASAVRDVASGMIDSREKNQGARGGITYCTLCVCDTFVVLIVLNDLNVLNHLNQRRSLARQAYSRLIAVSTSSRRQAQISNDIFVYEFQPRISILRGRGSSTEYSALIRPGLAVSSTTLSDI